jgi:hypothetical protein
VETQQDAGEESIQWRECTVVGFEQIQSELNELFVKRERPQQVSYRILPNFVEFLVGRLDLGCRDPLRQMRHPRGAAPGVQQHRLVRIWPL